MKNYEVVEQFLTKEQCGRLIDAYKKNIPSNMYRFHGGRRLIPNTSAIFTELVNKSEDWRQLAKKLEDPIFVNGILKKLDINDTSYVYVPYYTTLRRLTSKFGSRPDQPVRNSNLIFLFVWLIYSATAHVGAKIFSLVFKAFNKTAVELFYDASSAVSGYKREIHRDSDSRVFVFLIYLNSLKDSPNGSGGELCIYEPVDSSKKDLLPQPLESAVRQTQTLSPSEGRLVFFENSPDGYHSVSEMRGIEGERYFLYGALTILHGSRRVFRGSRFSLKTDFKMYL